MKIGILKGWYIKNMVKTNINKAKMKALKKDEVTFEIPSYISRYLESFKHEEFNLQIGPQKNQRTIFQNAKLWALIGEIDLELNGRRSKDGEDSIYRNLIEMANIQTAIFQIHEEALEEMKVKNIFRVLEVLEKEDQTILCRGYFGSSKFTTKEMADFIEAALDFAMQIGLDLQDYKDLMKGGK